MPGPRRSRAAGRHLIRLALIGAPAIVGVCGRAAAQPQVLAAVVNPANGRTYILLEQSTWTQARARALALGGHLATIGSPEENTFVYNTYSRFAGQNRNLWIGLHDLDEAANSTDRATRRLEFGWESGEPLFYSNWSPVEPNNPSSPEPTTWEFYVHIWQPGDFYHGAWNNLQDSTSVFGVPIHGVVKACAYAPVSPGAAQTCFDAPAGFSVSAVGSGTLAYQWQIEAAPGVWSSFGNDPMPLPCGGHAVAAPPTTSSTAISITGCTGVFGVRCVVTNACGSVAGDPAVITVDGLTCDLNQDGAADFTDVFSLIDTVGGLSLCPAPCTCDLSQDGATDFSDVFLLIDIVGGLATCQ